MEYLITILGFFLLYLVWYKGAKSYLLDAYRQRLFELRDELFDFVNSSNKIDFESLEYRTLRIRLNAKIRFAHRITFVDLVASMWLSKDTREAAQNIRAETEETLKSIKDNEARNFLKAIDEKSDMESAVYFIKLEPIILLIALFVLAGFIVKSLGAKSRKEYRNLTAGRIEQKYEDLWDLPLVDGRSEKVLHSLA